MRNNIDWITTSILALSMMTPSAMPSPIYPSSNPSWSQSSHRTCFRRSLHLVRVIDDQQLLFSRPLVVCENPDDYPESYRSNSDKEELILQYVDNFRRQYHYIYRDRKPLFLNPVNECGVTVERGSILSLNLFLCGPFLEIRLYNRAAHSIVIFISFSMGHRSRICCRSFEFRLARSTA
jgi:hypothetical protein